MNPERVNRIANNIIISYGDYPDPLDRAIKEVRRIIVETRLTQAPDSEERAKRMELILENLIEKTK